MEIMDMPKTIHWLNNSCDNMAALRADLASCAANPQSPLREELIAAKRARAQNVLNATMRGEIAIRMLVTSQLPLIMGQTQDFTTLMKSFNRLEIESDRTEEALKAMPADPTFVSCCVPGDDVETVVKKLREKL